MDPTTTLFTFLLETHPSIQSVHLRGSWDNFSNTYRMERDMRRDPGQWKGCYSFKDIICDGDRGASSRRNGGLKMGETYYFYYELDGTREMHDPSLPSTTACPYLPGQVLNTMSVPVEQSNRTRSASLTSIRNEDFKTMDPATRFVTPRPPPPVPEVREVRLATSPASLKHKRSARSLSPSPNWSWSPRRLFSRKASSRSLSSRDGERPVEQDNRPQPPPAEDPYGRPPSARSHTRALSPELLRRFLSDDALVVLDPNEHAERPAISIPEDIAEEHEDDDNFATSAASESLPPTVLSPPPFKRAFSDSTVVQLPKSSRSENFMKPFQASPAPTAIPHEKPTRAPPAIPVEKPAMELCIPRSHFSFSSASSLESAASSPQTPDDLPPFYHSEDDADEDVLSCLDGEAFPFPPLQGLLGSQADTSVQAAFSGYSLPRSSLDNQDKVMAQDVGDAASASRSPAVMARSGTGVPTGSSSLLAVPVDAGLDDFANDLGWMADVIRGKNRV
ncbi:hypothetical protein NKR23_g11151 [Pleurostoma richardsiae]|uniref:Uncharacterized protein n=1 Tax=Pleurostoma richardsiae TaxID=41990 RepID=A0AA38VHL5_9PEZI|nr:hypothetical protein NKR23_g11151 [Pleurostoma richardsiae]